MKVAVTDYTFDSLDTENAVLTPLGHTVAGAKRYLQSIGHVP